MNKKTKLAILGVIGLVFVTLSLTYAYWLITRTQTKENVITAGCLDISLSNEQNDISLTEQFPLSDDEGKELTPYTFTVTNNCNTAVDYYISLEALGDKDAAMSAKSLKVMLNESTPEILSYSYEEEPTIIDAYTSYRIGFGTLHAKESEDYALRLWIDEEAPISEMNKTFSSKISVTVGQGINNPLKEGTLAYDLVSQYGGKEAIKTLSTDKKEGDWTQTTVSYHGFLTTKFKWGTSYEYDEDKGYKVSGSIVEATIQECDNGSATCGRYTTKSEMEYSNKIYDMLDFERSGGPYYEFNANIKGIVSDIDVLQNIDGELSDMFAIADDYGISYFLSGKIDNNFVQFGTYAKNETITTIDDEDNEYTYSVTANEPMYWRIVRINGDGTVRLVYDGPEKINVNAQAYNYNSSIGLSAMTDGNLGFTYTDSDGKQLDSPIKDMLDSWYESNLKTKYGKYIADAIFCEDKEEDGYIDGSGNPTEDLTAAAGTAYASYKRILNTTPKLRCNRDEDKYTVSSKNGNGHLRNPIGIMTADELQLSADLILYGYAASWIMAPIAYMDNFGYAYALNSGEMYPGSEQLPVRPVINLKADVLFTGNGSFETPYVITTK